MADVRLVDLEVIKKYSLAVRHDTVPAEEVLAALEASLEVVRAALGPAKAPTKSVPARAPKAAPASRRPATKKSGPKGSGSTGTGAAETRRRSGRAGSE